MIPIATTKRRSICVWWRGGPREREGVLLDADGVIQDAVGEPPQAIVRLLGTMDRLPEFMDELFGAGYQAITGEVDVVDLIAGVLRRWGCAGALDDALELWNMIEVDDDAIEVVKSIR